MTIVDRPTLPAAPVARGRPLTDRGAVTLAVTVAAGAWWHHPVPLALAVAVSAIALGLRRPALVVLAGFALASCLGARSMAGMGPAPSGSFAGRVTLVADPEPEPFGAKVDVRVGSRRLELWATDGAAGAVSHALAGERLWVEGRTHPPRPGSPWLVPRHVVGRLEVDRAEAIDGGSWPWQAANRFRRLLGRGAEAIPEPSRSLYGGFVLGDDRGQPAEIVDDFRGAGLTHLLVVSGENVAFVLVLAAPLVRRLPLTGRWAVTIAVIVGFGVITRFEPSVLRASAMAALAASASLLGRPAATLRLLALATAGLLLVDPLLVRSVGFQLSVAASVGIALLATPIADRIPGPGSLAEALGVTIAAQLGVAPVLVPQFGGLPVVAVVANVLAVPLAGLVTTWGLPAGIVAGAFGGRVAWVVHLPTQACVWWVAGVARIAAAVPLGELGMRGLVVAAAAGAAAVVWTRRHPAHRAHRWVAAVVIGAVLLQPAVALRSPPPHQLVAGGDLYRSGGATVLVLAGPLHVADLLQDLRRDGVRRIDLLVTPGAPSVELGTALRHRWAVGRTVQARAGPAHGVVGALVVDVGPDGEVTVGPARPSNADR